jgi:hypothetical protein
MPLLPLEELFRKRTLEHPTELPQSSHSYFKQYEQLVNVLRTDYYSKIDAGLAANSTLPGELPGIYTAHDSEHFDEVIVQAGALLNADLHLNSSVPLPGHPILNAYELYILLVAIRIHDVGNIYGRNRHEKKCFQILRDMGAAAGLHNPEKKIIANIAQAHGGFTDQGSKDTIGELDITSDAANVVSRPRLLAGIVRIADEICENRRRATNVLLESGTLPKQSEIYHRYAASILGNRWSPVDRALHLTFWIRLCDVEKPWGCEDRAPQGQAPITEVYLLDEIFSRLEKMDRERRYCNMYTREMFTIDSIKATLKIVTDEDHDDIEAIPIPVLSDRGYPNQEVGGLKAKLQKYCGAEYGAALRARTYA